jgi:hypothetical protein
MSLNPSESSTVGELDAVESPVNDGNITYGNGFLDNNGLPPTKYDVLLGRGKYVQHHKGNIRLHTIIQSYRSRYIHGDKRLKTQCSADILNLVQVNGKRSGRFLKFDNRTKTWTEVDDSIARQKVGHAIRDSLRAPVLRERKSEKRLLFRKYNTKRNLEKMAQDIRGGRPEQKREDAAKLIDRDLSAEDIINLRHRYNIEGSLPAARTYEEISKNSSISSGNTDTHRRPIHVTAEQNPSSLMTKETIQAPPFIYPVCTLSRLVVGQIVNLQDVPPELLASSRSFVTFLSKVDEDSVYSEADSSQYSSEEE